MREALMNPPGTAYRQQCGEGRADMIRLARIVGQRHAHFPQLP